jgi:hypothetical protein
MASVGGKKKRRAGGGGGEEEEGEGEGGGGGEAEGGGGEREFTVDASISRKNGKKRFVQGGGVCPPGQVGRLVPPLVHRVVLPKDVVARCRGVRG